MHWRPAISPTTLRFSPAKNGCLQFIMIRKCSQCRGGGRGMLSVPATLYHSPATSNLFENPDKWYSSSQLRVTPSILSGFPDSLPVPIYTPGWREAL